MSGDRQKVTGRREVSVRENEANVFSDPLDLLPISLKIIRNKQANKQTMICIPERGYHIAPSKSLALSKAEGATDGTLDAN